MSLWEAVHRDFREYPSQASFVGFGPEGNS
jgi:hypothetical protein